MKVKYTEAWIHSDTFEVDASTPEEAFEIIRQEIMTEDYYLPNEECIYSDFEVIEE